MARLTTIEVDEREAQIFVRYQFPFMDMANAGVFEVRDGSAELHFDVSGILQKIIIHHVAFKRGVV